MANSERNRLLKMLKDDGWVYVGGKGDHWNFKHPTKKGKVTVPYEITKNIELSVQRKAGLR